MAGEGPTEFDPVSFLARVTDGQTVSEYKKSQIVYQQGDPADSVWYLKEGSAKATVLSALGKEAIVAMLRPGDFFGEGSMAGQRVRMATIETLTACVIVRLQKENIVRVIHEQPAFAELFIAYLLARNIRVEEDLVDQLFNSSEKRLARTLLLLANFGKDGPPEKILPNISQETLAEMIGTTRSRVSFFMNRFRDLGLISYNGHIEVHRSLWNVVLHEKPHIKD